VALPVCCTGRLARSSPIHEFQGTFLGQPAAYKVTSVIGHVYNTDFDDAFQDWDLDPALL
jgi:DNA topoisomerase IA